MKLHERHVAYTHREFARNVHVCAIDLTVKVYSLAIVAALLHGLEVVLKRDTHQIVHSRVFNVGHGEVRMQGECEAQRLRLGHHFT